VPFQFSGDFEDRAVVESVWGERDLQPERVNPVALGEAAFSASTLTLTDLLPNASVMCSIVDLLSGQLVTGGGACPVLDAVQDAHEQGGGLDGVGCSETPS